MEVKISKKQKIRVNKYSIPNKRAILINLLSFPLILLLKVRQA